MQKQRIQKLITFSPKLYTIVEEKANRLGVSFPEYIRSLALEDIKDEQVPFMVASEELDTVIGQSLDEAKTGKLHEFDPDNDADMDDLFGGK